MVSLDVLLVMNVVVAAWALLKLRPATFILAGNQVLAVKALTSVRDFGQPVTQSHVPAIVYRPENVETAANIFAISTLLLFLSLLAFRSTQKAPLVPEQMTALPKALLWVMGFYFLALILGSGTILNYGYVDPTRERAGGFSLGGAHVLILGVLIYELRRRVLADLLTPKKAFGFVLALVTLTDFLKGGTGIATGVLATSAVLLLGIEPLARKRWVTLPVAVLTLVLAAMVVRGVRASLHAEGSEAFSAFFQGMVEEDRSRTGEGAEKFGNAVQTATHILACITLYDSNVSREWRSLYNILEYTLKPSFLMGPLGLTRSRDAPWELADHFIHSGGINTLGELYWNGGYLCVFLVWGALVALALLGDTRYRYSLPWLLVTCSFCPGLLQGFGYGINQVSRGLFNGVLLILVFKVATWIRKSRARPSPTRALPSPSAPQ
jgi:hypothetical protein